MGNADAGRGMFADRSSQLPPLPPPRHFFPLVRQLSRHLTPVLLRLPASPNQITAAAIAVGMLSAGAFLIRGLAGAIAGVLLFILCQVLDNCDGEVARLKGLQSRFGARLDDCGDWLVHSALFVALGVRTAAADGRTIWIWLGAACALGISLEYTFGLFRHSTAATEPTADALDPSGSVSPFDLSENVSWMDKTVYVFRVLIDADFCFILPLFVFADLLPVLLPAAAIGNQAYWAAAFYENARRFHA